MILDYSYRHHSSLVCAIYNCVWLGTILPKSFHYTIALVNPTHHSNPHVAPAASAQSTFCSSCERSWSTEILRNLRSAKPGYSVDKSFLSKDFSNNECIIHRESILMLIWITLNLTCWDSQKGCQCTDLCSISKMLQGNPLRCLTAQQLNRSFQPLFAHPSASDHASAAKIKCFSAALATCSCLSSVVRWLCPEKMWKICENNIQHQCQVIEGLRQLQAQMIGSVPIVNLTLKIFGIYKQQRKTAECHTHLQNSGANLLESLWEFITSPRNFSVVVVHRGFCWAVGRTWASSGMCFISGTSITQWKKKLLPSVVFF